MKPKGAYPEFELEYDNLLCSCQPLIINDEKILTCGHKKGEYYDEHIFVSPLKQECEHKIRYSSSGELKGYDEAAEITIEKLGLNNYDLVRSRRYTIADFCRDKKTKDELKKILKIKEGKYHPFHTSIIQFFSI